MNLRVVPFLALLTMLAGTAANGQATRAAATPSGREPPLRASEPADAVVADLESFVPEYMREQDIPGLAVALIREGKVVWTEGFGVANAFTRQPVTPETMFEVASISKMVVAYIALRLADQGKLSLDEPLNAYLSEPWISSSGDTDAVTLRHVLSHTSGLGSSITISRGLRFAPGSGYYYSGIGFLYLQEVIEEVASQSLESLAGGLVFEPLGLLSSTFVSEATIARRVANGHVNLALPLLLFIGPTSIIFIVVGLVALVIQRVWTGHWRTTLRMMVGVYVAAAILYLLSAFLLIGETLISFLPEFVSLTLLSTALLAIVFAGMAFIGHRIATHSFAPRTGTIRATVVTGLWAVLSLVGLLWLASLVTTFPVPKGPPPQPNAAGTLMTTAGDLATFLIELAEPQHLGPEILEQMRTPQVSLSSDLSWGLGFGIQHGDQGDALWQWGQHIDFQSIAIIYPRDGFGVVVCTNSDLLNPDVAMDVAHRALGGKIEPIHRAIRLEFNYAD